MNTGRVRDIDKVETSDGKIIYENEKDKISRDRCAFYFFNSLVL